MLCHEISIAASASSGCARHHVQSSCDIHDHVIACAEPSQPGCPAQAEVSCDTGWTANCLNQPSSAAAAAGSYKPCVHFRQLLQQVVIRVRPPLPRELQGFTEYQCTSLVDARSGQLITISENLPAVLSGQGASDGMLYATYRCVCVHSCSRVVSLWGRIPASAAACSLGAH